MEKEIKEKLIEWETYNYDGIQCPYCGHIEKDGEVKYQFSQDEMEKFDCPACEKSMNVAHDILHSWSATPRDNNFLESEIKRIEKNIASLAKENSVFPNSSILENYRQEIAELKEEIKV